MHGRVALVTGAAQGIGRAIALRLAGEGADVVVADLNEAGAHAVADEARGLGRRALAVRVDVSRHDEVDAMVERTVAELGGLDIAVANAGIILVETLLETREEDWERLFAVNVKGVWLTAVAAARQMIRQGRGGRIILAGSRAGKTPSRLVLVGAYATTKHAVVGLTRALAFELAEHQITVNAYCPGLVDTPMWDTIDREMTRRLDVPRGTMRARGVAQIPLGRAERPEDVANLVAWLVSDESAYLTGQSINVDGGTEVH
ncbi:MAG: glucose 1-dehydrogenase [Chloroflexi bacterium]|nr:glucose 1-dehydrogenase [Chloroflexota bacterium]